MPAPVEAPDVVVAHVGDHLLELGVLPEEVLPGIAAALGLEVLVLAVDRLLHAPAEQPLGVAHQEGVPVRAPDHLDDVPAGPAERRLQLLDDLAVAPHRAVEALEVAVDDEDEVVELLPRGEGDRPERLGLVHLPVAGEAPHLAPLGAQQPAVVEVAHEPGVVDRLDGSETHRHGGELPERGHEPRVGIGREPASVRLLAEAVEILLLEPALEERAGVDPGRRMALDVDEVPAVLRGRGVPEMVEPDLVQGGGGGEARDVAPELGALPVRLHHHRHRVPAHQRADAPFDRRVAGGVALPRLRYGVEVGGVGRVGEVRAGAAGLRDEVLDEEVGARDPVALQHRLERLQPLLGLRRIDVVTGLRLNACDHARSRVRLAG